MGKGIYTYYKERLIEIGGKNRCLYLKSVTGKNAYDIGRIFEGRDDKVAEFVEFLWAGKSYPLTLIDKKEKADVIRNIEASRKSPRPEVAEEELDEAAEKGAERRTPILSSICPAFDAPTSTLVTSSRRSTQASAI